MVGAGRILRLGSAAPPVGLPRVQHVRVVLAQVRGFQVQEVKEVLDCLGEGLPLRYREDGIEQIVNIRLKDSL